MQPQEQSPTAYQYQSNNSVQKSPRNKKVIFLIFLLVLVLLASGGLGYLLMKEKDAHAKTKQELQSQISRLNDANRQLELTKYQDSIRAALQPDTNRECFDTKSSILFNITTSTEKNSDGSVKKRFGVAQFICNNGDSPGSTPIRFAAVQSYDGKNWEFTYGSSTSSPTLLPGYIYNTDPSLFKAAYNNPSHN